MTWSLKENGLSGKNKKQKIEMAKFISNHFETKAKIIKIE